MTTQGEPFERGYKLGKYEVIGRISVGGMAELYLAFLTGQGGFRKFVALKRVLPSVAEQESFVKMFLDEARITAALSHANIAQVFELAETAEDAEPVLAMEFVAGQNIAQIVKRARAREVELTPGFSCRVVHDVLLGLHSAHHFVEPTSGRPMPVIHRDINPRNIMVTYTGGTKIIDFGIAKARGRLDTTQVGMVKGTLQYMSPEQVLLKELDGRSDLFAVSVVLYELLSGKRLFDDPSDAALLQRIVHGEVPSLATVAPALPARLVEVVMKGLARKAEDRWKSGREYARALDQALPEFFDDEQVAQLMGRLFADKIDITRALLQSTTTDASYANLKLMAQAGDEAESKPSVPAPQPIADVPTSPSHQKLDTTASSRPRVEDAGPAETVNGRPPPQSELPTELGRKRPAGEVPSTSATMIMSEPLLAAPSATSAPTEADLEPVVSAPAVDEAPTAPERARVEPAPAGTLVEGGGRRPTGGVPAQGRKRTVDAQPIARKPTHEVQAAGRGPPIADATTLRRTTSSRSPVPAVTLDTPSSATVPGAESARPVPRADEGEAGTISASGSSAGSAEKTNAGGWVLWVVLGTSVLALLAALALYASTGGQAPTPSRPLGPSAPRPAR